MNEAFARSVCPSTPSGVEERVRLDKIVVTSTAPPTDWAEDEGYYGEYLYDVPEQTYLRIFDNEDNPVSGVSIKLYQRSSEQGLYGSRSGMFICLW